MPKRRSKKQRAAASSPSRGKLHLRRPRKGKPGTSPGLESHELTPPTPQPPQFPQPAQLPPASPEPSSPSGTLEAAAESVRVWCIDYGPLRTAVTDVTDLADFLHQPRPLWAKVRWINIEGITDMTVIQLLVDRYHLHPLAVEDVLHTPQRPKFDLFPPQGDSPERLFVIARMMYLTGGELHNEQVSLFLGPNTLLSFQEMPGDIWSPIRQRISQDSSRLRQYDTSFLFYALLDAMVDHCFPILEHYGDQLEDLEDAILREASPQLIHDVHRIKRDLLLLRRVAWPMREVINSLQRDPPPHLSKTTQTYLRDVYDHVVQIIDLIETYRELAASLTETYMTAMSNRMNQVMKLLTVIATIFIPLTFLAGVYGMNFQYMPELTWKWAYPAVWCVFIATAGVMLWWFRRKQWL